jgi:hypothetical protein
MITGNPVVESLIISLGVLFVLILLVPNEWITPFHNKRIKPVDTEFEKALSFCYALLAPSSDASDLIAQNKDRALAAHKALYERRPHTEPYDVMMARMKTLDDSRLSN